MPRCKNNVELDSIIEHYKKCANQKERTAVACQWCEKIFASKASLDCHTKYFHGRGKFVCPDCQFTAQLAKDLINHLEKEAGHSCNIDINCPCCKNLYPAKEMESHYKSCLIDRKMQQNYRQPIKCTTCGKMINGRDRLKTHMISHLRAEGANETDSKMRLYHYCDKCGERFRTNHYLIQHIRSVHDKIDYTCSECPMRFKLKDQLYRHKRLAHSTDDKSKCKYCGRRFPDATLTRKHELSHEDPQFQCRFCSKLLKTQRSLLAHERAHTGEKPFACNMCSAQFASKNSLNQHQQGVHKVIGPRGGTGWLKKEKTYKLKP